MSQVRIFVSFDVEHDQELYDRISAQSRNPDSCFGVHAGSEGTSATAAGHDRVQREICEADQLIVICGEHTESSPSVSAELRIAQRERRPYFLLWGRREIMCTKPVGATSDDAMYSWTGRILQDQIAFTLRTALAEAAAEALRSGTRTAQTPPADHRAPADT